MNSKSTNPILRNLAKQSPAYGEATVTYAGVAAKTALLLCVVIATALWQMSQYRAGGFELVQTLMWVGALGGFGVAMLTFFVQRLAPVTSFIYAALEGLLIGGLCAFLEVRNPGVAINAGLLTMGLFTAMLAAYAKGIVQVTQRYKALVGAAIFGIMIAYLFNLVLNLFGSGAPFLYGGGTVGVAINVFVIVIAVLTLAIDFDAIQRFAENGAPKKSEWMLAFGLLVTLVWLYIEVLRLLARRD